MTLHREHGVGRSGDPGGSQSRSPSILLYSHDGFGLGHLSRTIYLAQSIRALEPAADILVVTSSPAANRFVLPEEFEYIKLPSVTKTGVERYRPRLAASLESVVELRSTLLLNTVQHLRPDLLLVDHRPLGLKREVLPTLEWIRQCAPETRTVVGLRDVIDDPETVIRDWTAQGIYDALERLYDLILVYGQQSILDSTKEYALPESMCRKVRFTGYLGRGPARRSREEVRRSLGLDGERLIVVHAGGGGDGFALIDTYLRCVEQLPEGIHSLVATGPLMTRREREHLWHQAAALPVTLVECQEDLASCVAAADLSVSMGGYNTICEILSAGVRALVAPRVFPRREQHIRAHRLAALGLIDVLLPTALNPDTLATKVRLSLLSWSPGSQRLSLDGGTHAAQLVTSLLPAETRSSARRDATLRSAH